MDKRKAFIRATASATQEDSAATPSRPTLVGPIPKFPKVRCDACGQIYLSTAVVCVPHTKPCPNCGSDSFSSSFTAEAT